MRILIADDDSTSRLALQATLRKLGYEVDAAKDGEEAVALYRPGVHQIVVADWMMPGLDGLEVTRRIRAQDGTAYTYVILLTGKGAREDRVTGLEAGADDFIVKPFDAPDLSARLGVAGRILRMEGELKEANRKIEATRKQEATIGATIQRSLLMARPPDAARTFEFAAMNLPSRSIDGDFYDFFVHSPSVVDVVLGDAMGKGVPAALVGAGAKSTLLRSLTALLSVEQGRLPEPAAIVQTTHDAMTNELISLGSFVTLAYARLDGDARRATFVDCGHTQVIHWSVARGEATEIPGGGFPIGFVPRETYDAREVPFDMGDLFFFYSDGVTDATGENEEPFGTGRLLEIVRSFAGESPSQILYRLREAIHDHVGAAPLEDDFTVVIVRAGPALDPWEMRSRLFRSDLDVMTEMRAYLGGLAHECGLPPGKVDNLLLAAHEAATNVVRHAHGRNSDREFEIVATRLEDGIRVRVFYEGPPFNPEEPQVPDPEESEFGGLGLYVIQQAVTKALYGRESGRNVIELDQRV